MGDLRIELQAPVHVLQHDQTQCTRNDCLKQKR